MTLQSDIAEITSNRRLLNSFSGKKVLVTGASGFIGSMLIRTFVAANTELNFDINVTGLVRDEIKARDLLGEVADEIELVLYSDFQVEGDLDYIFHTASPTKSKYFVDCPVEAIDAVLFGTKRMLEVAKKTNVTFVYLSSMEEYGIPYSSGDVMTEDKVGVIDHLNIRSCYPEGKRMCECMCVAYTSEYNVDTKIVRLAQTFGSGAPLNDNRVSMQFAKSVVEGKDIVLHTEGKSISNFCYITDAIAGILTVAIKGKTGEAYNVCNDVETRSIYDIAKLVAEEVAGHSITVVKNIPLNINLGYAPDNSMRLDSTKLRQLGWIPIVSMEEGYRRLISYIKENDLSS